MMSLHHGWGWQPPQTDSPIHIRHMQSVWAHWYAVQGHTVAALHRPTLLGSNLGFLGHLWSQMSSLRPGWDWQPPQTASLIHIRHMQSIWTNWYAVHGHIVAALHSHTHTSLFSFVGSQSLVESKWRHYVMVEATRHLKLLPSSILYIYKVSEHIDMLSMGIE